MDATLTKAASTLGFCLALGLALTPLGCDSTQALPLPASSPTSTEQAMTNCAEGEVSLRMSAPACRKKKNAECKQIIALLNNTFDNRNEESDQVTEASVTAGYRGIADRLDKVGAALGKLELTTPELKKYSSEYQAMATDIANAARDMAVAVEAKDRAKDKAAQVALDKAVKAEEPLVDSMNTFCQANQ